MNDEKTKQETKEEALSPVEQATKILSEINSAKEELKNEKAELETLKANNLLSGTAGGHVEAPMVDPADIATKQALDFWKGTAIEDAIKRENG
jgi:hypothetical protein